MIRARINAPSSPLHGRAGIVTDQRGDDYKIALVLSPAEYERALAAQSQNSPESRTVWISCRELEEVV